MKKFLLFAALAAGALNASADYSDYFEITIDGNKVENGSVYTTNASTPDAATGLNKYDVHILMTPKVDYDFAAYATVLGINPTTKEVVNNFMDWGVPGVCIDGACGPADGLYLSTVWGDVLPEGLTFDYHSFAADGKSTDYQVSFYAGANKGDFDSLYDGAVFSFNIVCGGNTAVDEIAVADAEPVYYNLQGVEVANPESGLYIVKRGQKVSKEIVRK